MADLLLRELPLQENLYELLFRISDTKSSNLKETLDSLVATSKNSEARRALGSKNIVPCVLRLTQSLSHPAGYDYLFLSLKLLRNLCAGEISNQNSFLEHNGVGVIADVLKFARDGMGVDNGMIRLGLQVLANVSLASTEHQYAIWNQFFLSDFHWIAKVRNQETCDPLCMIIYVCCDGICELVQALGGVQGLPIVAEVVRTASAVGFKEDWFKLLLSRICLESDIFPRLFSCLSHVDDSKSSQYGQSRDSFFTEGQAYLLNVLSAILNERIEDIAVPHDFTLYVFEILKKSIGFVDFYSRGKTGLPTGSVKIDVIGHSLSMVRDICARDSRIVCGDGSVDVDKLLSLGLLDLLLQLLGELEPPSTIRKTLRKSESQESSTSDCEKVCPYQGFRRDIVAIIGNCAYRRKHVQDEIRHKNRILLLLQQCVTDVDNPYLREWGIWAVRNILDGNPENQQAVAELEIQGSVQTPELTGVGLRVEVDQNTKRAKLVNVSG